MGCFLGVGAAPTYNIDSLLRSFSIRWALFSLAAVIALAWTSDARAGVLNGVVYDAKTGKGLDGVQLELFYDDTDPLEPGTRVPSERLRPGEQPQQSGADGSYVFDLPTGRVYRLQLTSRADHHSFPSVVVQPLDGFPRFGEISPSVTPSDAGRRPFYLRFDSTIDIAAFFNNHIAVDLISDVVELTLKSNRPKASLGDVITFSAVLSNRSQRALTAAEGSPVLLELVLARGLSINSNATVAEVQIGSSAASPISPQSMRARLGSDRLVRFGPFDVPAGAVLRVHYQATVGIATKEGRRETHMVARDPGGVELSNRAVSSVAIVKDREFGTSTILGRVYCDADGNGKQGRAEPGVFGARIYSDSGTIAISDRVGRFHFTRIQPGSHIFKIDNGSLAGGKARLSDRRLLRLTEALPGQLEFPVDCGREWISHEDARIVLPLLPPKKQIKVEPADRVGNIALRGRLSPMTLSLGGKRLDVPSVELKQDIPNALVAQPASRDRGVTLLALPKGGYQRLMPHWTVRWNSSSFGTPKSWRFTIERVEAGGLAPVLHRQGEGTPPPHIEWNGLGDSGKILAAGEVYAVRLTMISTDGVEVASARHPFGIAAAGGGGKIQTLRGQFFTGARKKTKASAELVARVQSILSQLGDKGSVQVEVHGDGTGDRFQSLVQTQLEAKIVGAFFAKAGIAKDRVSVRGRGESEPIDTTGGSSSKEKNRRVVFTLTAALGETKLGVATVVKGKSALRIDGRLTPVQSDGGFETRIPRDRGGFVAVDLLAESGRRAAFRVRLPEPSHRDRPSSSARRSTSMSRSEFWAESRKIDREFRKKLALQVESERTGIPIAKRKAMPAKRLAPSTPAPRRPAPRPRKVTRTWEVEGNVLGNTLAIDFEHPPDAVWQTDARLTTTSALPIPEIQTEFQGGKQVLSSPMDFRLLVANTLSIKRWQLVVAEETGDVIHRESKEGPVPSVLRWDGTSGSKLVLGKNKRYRYWLDIETNDASGFQSAPHWFHVDPVKSAILLERRGRFFKKSSGLRASLKNPLLRFAAKQKHRAKERFSVVLEVVGDRPRVDQSRAALVAYMSGLGIAPALYDLEARELVQGKDRIAIVRDTRPPKSIASVRINGRRVALQNGAFSETVELAPHEPIVVEMTATSGAKLRQVGAQTKEGVTETAGGELIPPGPMDALEGTVNDVPDNEILASNTPAKSLRVHLPSKGVILGDSHLAISGSVDKGSIVKVNDEVVTLEPDGTFYVVTSLPIGRSEIEVRADDELGGSSTIVWPVHVARTHHIALGLIEGIAASAYTSRGWMADSAAISGMGRRTTFQVGSMLLSARAQGYVKARLSGGAFSDTLEVTAHVDTGRERASSAFFEQIVNPTESQPVMGDDAAELQDVNTRGRVYARVVAGDSSAVIGSVHTRLEGGGDLFKYDRTADGAVGNLRRRIGGNGLALRAFTTSGNTSSSRAVNWFRATGGSLYYLRHGYVLEGSEKVRIVVRDRDSGLPLSEEDLVAGVDYAIDYKSGRIRLTDSLNALSRSSWVLDNMDSSATPMGGNYVFLNVRYEHEDQDGLSQRASGAYASSNLEDRLSVGAGVVSEKRSGQESYSLIGADASLNLGKRSNLRAEVAASRQRDASHSMSQDGGLSFGGMQLGSEFEGGPTADYRIGWKVSLDLVADDYTSANEFKETTFSAYLQDLDTGFSSGDSVLDQGRFKFGGRIQHRLTDNDRLLLRHEAQIAELPRVGPTVDDVMANPNPEVRDERASYITSLQWARDAGLWHYKLEGMHQRLTSTASLNDGSAAIDSRRVGIGVLTAYEYSKLLQFRVGQQFVANTQSADPVTLPVQPMNSPNRGANTLAGIVTNVGSDLRLAPDLSLTADLYQRWNGDNAARVGMRTAVSDQGSMYVQEQVAGVSGRLTNSTIVGAEDRFGEDGGGRSYGEYQLHRGVLGGRNSAVMGLGRRWQLTKLLGIGFGFEHQQAFGGYLPDGTSIGNAQRNVLHASYTVRHRDRLRITGRLELRLDNGDSGGNVDPAVLGSDPRPGQKFGAFSDRGGALVGAALVIAPGKQNQVLAGMAAEWKLDESHTWLGRVRSSLSTRKDLGQEDYTTLARFNEVTTGISYRPARSQALEFLARYSFLSEQRPGGFSGSVRRERSHVLAILPFARLPKRFQLSGKLAVKFTAALDQIASLPAVATDTTAILTLVRLGYRFYGKWDASAEARNLILVGQVDDESKFGTLLELGYAIGRYVRLGAGYNLSRFSDDELGDLQRDSHGFFVRVTGQY